MAANKQQLIQVIAIMTLIIEVLSVASFYLPDIGRPISSAHRGPMRMSRREDSDSDGDDDELDSNASAPYQNQDDGSGGATGQQDGYEENEPDGPYGETPREEEGQADLERFFDDHLGASERDGMDKENLPSNLVEYVSLSQPASQIAAPQPFIYNLPNLPQPMVVSHPMVAQASKSIASYYRRPNRVSDNNVELRYLKLPDDRVIIVHHEERNSPTTEGGPAKDDSLGSHLKIRVPDEILRPTRNNNNNQASRRSDNFGDRIVVAENDDEEKVYVTRAINKPFKINGYDPERDFREAERELNSAPASGSRRRKGDRRAEMDSGEGSPLATRDINFNDGDADTMFNDASETDEITFAQDDPYQTDLEAEMRSQAFDKPTPVVKTMEEAPEVRITARRRRGGGGGNDAQDDSEGGWINDGVDEMDIPSQSHQDKVLDKAAKQQEAAAAAADSPEAPAPQADRRSDYEEPDSDERSAAREEASPTETASDDHQEQQRPDDDGYSLESRPSAGQASGEIDPENQRMPNANYLRNYSDEPDEYDDNEAL